MEDGSDLKLAPVRHGLGKERLGKVSGSHRPLHERLVPASVDRYQQNQKT